MIFATCKWATCIANYCSDCLTVITRRTMIMTRAWRCTRIAAVIGSYWMPWTATTHTLILKQKDHQNKQGKRLVSIMGLYGSLQAFTVFSYLHEDIMWQRCQCFRETSQHAYHHYYCRALAFPQNFSASLWTFFNMWQDSNRGSAHRKASMYTRQHTTERCRHTSMSQVGFKLMIPVFE